MLSGSAVLVWAKRNIRELLYDGRRRRVVRDRNTIYDTQRPGGREISRQQDEHASMKSWVQ
jgi:hypothetical protein